MIHLERTEEEIAELNNFLKSIISISSGSKSFKVEGDPFTKWDSQYITTTKYVDGRIEISESIIDKDASERLHKINSILEDWGFKRQNYVGGHFEDKFYWHVEKDPIHKSFDVEINPFHKTLFNIDGCRYEWNDKTIEDFLNDKIERFIEKNAGPILKRDLKIRNVLKSK